MKVEFVIAGLILVAAGAFGAFRLPRVAACKKDHLAIGIAVVTAVGMVLVFAGLKS